MSCASRNYAIRVEHCFIWVLPDWRADKKFCDWWLCCVLACDETRVWRVDRWRVDCVTRWLVAEEDISLQSMMDCKVNDRGTWRQLHHLQMHTTAKVNQLKVLSSVFLVSVFHPSDIHLCHEASSTCTFCSLVVKRSSNGVGSIIEVTLRWSQLVVAPSTGEQTTLVCNHSSRQTQPPTLIVAANEYRPKCSNL